MEKNKIKLYVFLLIIITITGCNTSYLGHYYNKSNSGVYNSEIEIDNNYLIYRASSDMLGTVVQKENYLIDKDSIIVKFKSDILIKSCVFSSFDSQIKGIKINLLSILPNDSIAPIANITVNDTIRYLSKSNDTILNISQLKKIEFNDTGLNLIKDTIINFSHNNDNVLNIRLQGIHETPVLSENGTVKYLVKGKKLYVLKYNKLTNKYIKSERYYIKK